MASRQIIKVVGAAMATLVLMSSIPDVGAERLPVKSYTVADGLSHDRVKNIIRDSRGFLWICTVEGLSRFDGYRFVNYGLEKGLPGGNINHLLETRAGQYWVATTNGVGRFNPAPHRLPDRSGGNEPRFTAFRVGDNERTNNVRVLYEDRSGQIWAGTSGGLYRWVENQGSFERFDQGLLARADCFVTTMTEDAEGSIWMGSSYGLLRLLQDGRLLEYRLRWPETGESVSFRVKADAEGRLWMLHSKGLLVFRPEPVATAASRALPWVKLTRQQACVQMLDGSQNTDCRTRTVEINPSTGAPHLSLASGEAWLYVGVPWTSNEAGLVLHQTADRQIWIGTDLGLFAFDGATFRKYTTGQGLSEDVIVAVNEDIDGNLWVGGFSTGAMKIVRQGFTSFTKADGLGDLRVTWIGNDKTGAVYASGTNWLISRFDGQRFTAVQPRLAPPMPATGWQFFHNSFQDHNGEWWTATSNGLYRFPAVERIEQLATTSPVAVYTTRDGLPSNFIRYFFEDVRGDLWISFNNDSPLTRFDRATNSFQQYTAADGLPNGMPNSFCEDVNGNIWIGLPDGLVRYRAGRFSHWSTIDGAPKGIIREIFSDHAGRVWIASSLGGVARIDDPAADTPTFKIYSVAEGLSGNATRCLAEDKFGRIYVGVGRGVDRLDPATGRIKHYTTEDGLANSFVSSGFRDREGNLWFGMLNGLSRLIPEPDLAMDPVPVWISGLHIAGAEYAVSEFGEANISLPALEPEQNRIRIDFFGMGFSTGEPLRYQYKLEGAGQDWSSATELRTHEVSLGPGSYRFLVRAVRPDNSPTSSPASVTFRILPPIWLRWWFLLAAALMAATTVYAFGRYRYQRMKAVRDAEEALRRSQEERIADLERVRNRIATDLHDDIGSSLTQISILSEVMRQRIGGDDSPVNEPLSMIAASSRELVDSMSDIVWATNPQRDHLSDLVQRMRRFASDVFTARNIEFILRLPPADRDFKLEANLRREVFLIFKESVNNIVRHSGCTTAEIDFEVTDDFLSLRLSDNGKGFDLGKQNDGHGLISIRERAGHIGGRCELVSGNGNGTTVILKVPLGGAARPNA